MRKAITSRAEEKVTACPGVIHMGAAAVVSLLAAVALAFVPAAGAATVPVRPGEYVGMTTQLCPKFAVAAGACQELERLPMSLTVTATKVTSIRATVVEHCEDNLAPRIVEVEIPHSYRLHRENPGPNVIVSFNLRAGKGAGKSAGGWFKHQIGKGGLSFVEKDSEDPTGEAYCYARVGWRARPR
jgi:hypothetical protein